MPLKVQGQPYPFASHLQSDDLEIVPFELPPAALSNFAPGTSTPDLLAAIGGYLAAATAELSRLEDLSSTISKLGLDIDRGSDNPTTKMELECVISLAFHDIHFTAIVLDKVRQALRGLLPILADLAETASDPSICRSYHKHLQHMLCGYLDPFAGSGTIWSTSIQKSCDTTMAPSRLAQEAKALSFPSARCLLRPR